MPYLKRIIVLANSFKTGGFCVAGREWTPTGPGAWIRPVSFKPKAELSRQETTCQTGLTPKLLDIIDIGLLRPVPHDHQQENHLLDPSFRWIKQGTLPFDHMPWLRETPAKLWTDSDRTSTGTLNCVSSAEAALHQTSLHLIEAPNFVLETTELGNDRLSYRGLFQLGHSNYKLNVTDPCVTRRYSHYPVGQHALAQSGSVFLTISLTEPFDMDHRCHKLIAAVITDPPQ